MPYIGQSMSVNAAIAYDNGYKPYSKWTKQDILSRLENTGADIASYASYSTKVLREAFLTPVEWHHTGKTFNKTDFYDVDPEKSRERDLESIKNRLKSESIHITSKEPRNYCYALVEYESYEGDYVKYRHFVRHQEYAIVDGVWAYMVQSKKRLSGSHIKIIKKYSRAPRGSAATFQLIRKTYNL